MLTRRVELRSPVPPDHQATPYPTHLPDPFYRREPIKFSTSRRHVNKDPERIPYRDLSRLALERSRGSRHGCPYGRKRDKGP
jgi:hypothetical protein